MSKNKMMKRFSFVLGTFAKLTLLICAFSVKLSAQQEFFQTIHTQSSDNYEAGKSFANWFVASDIKNVQELESACNAIGFNHQALQALNKIGDINEWINHFRGEMLYYHELDSMYWKKVGDIVKNNFPAVEKKLSEQIKTKGWHVWMAYGPELNKSYLNISAVDIPDMKKVKWSIQGNIKAHGGFVNKKGKPIKVMPNEKPLVTMVERMDSTAVSFEFFMGGKALPLSAHLPELMQQAPFIRKYFLSEDKVMESRHAALTWEVYGVDQVVLNHTIGVKDAKGQVIVAPESTTEYELVAENRNGHASGMLKLEVERIYVKSIEVTFFCGDKKDPKMADQDIRIRVKNEDGLMLAEKVVGSGLEFKSDKPEGSYFGAFTPEPNEPVLKKQLSHGSFELTMEGKTKDHWEFSPLMIIRYTDGTKNSFFGYENQVLDTGAEPLIFKF